MTSKLDFVLGCRSPTSKYARDGVFIISRLRDSIDIIGAQFMNGMDFIGHPETCEEAIMTYMSFIESGWIPMIIDDLDKTAIDKEQIDNNTILEVSQMAK